MKDADFQTLLTELGKANTRYKTLLRRAEAEIERRYGAHPADIDNDMWIDVYHVGEGCMTVKDVDDSMVKYCDRRRIK